MNDTMQESKKATDTISVKATVLREVLEGASLHASKDSSLPTLNAVSIEGLEGNLSVLSR